MLNTQTTPDAMTLEEFLENDLEGMNMSKEN